MKREFQFLKRGRKEKKLENMNKKSSSKNEGETRTVVLDNDVLITNSMEEVCLYNSSCSVDWILYSIASHHVTPNKDNFIVYNHGNYGRVHLGEITFVILLEWEMFKLRQRMEKSFY